MTKSLAVLGATGSIGTQTLDVLATHDGLFSLDTLSAYSSLDELCALARAHRPRAVVVPDDAAATAVRATLPARTEVLVGTGGLIEAASRADVVVNAVVGFAGVEASIAALGAGRRLALANKESLIVAAPLVERVRATTGAELLPIDSEHCAIHQCLAGIAAAERATVVRRLVLTASGGPFRGRTPDELDAVTVDDALAHPTWKMGARITIDSSTLMNKGMEVLEAAALFELPTSRIDVVVHPQSIVHSMVELIDGSTLAQLSSPDMRLPIAYALGYPSRYDDGYGRLAFDAPMSLSFEPPDIDSFPCLSLAYEAGRVGGTAPAWLNAADECAVAAFLASRISWRSIATVIAATLDCHDGASCDNFETLLSADRVARTVASGIIDAMVSTAARP